jgi:hypothetical protein
MGKVWTGGGMGEEVWRVGWGGGWGRWTGGKVWGGAARWGLRVGGRVSADPVALSGRE